MSRHKLREQLFHLLFRVEFNGPEDMPEQVKLFFERTGEDPEAFERPLGREDETYIREKYAKIHERLPELDELLNRKASGWDISRMGKVELAILRLALYEILFDQDVPPGVAVDEAVELAKRYGQENSGAFVNGVLAKFMPKAEAQEP